MRPLIAMAIVLAAVPALAQTPAQTPPSPGTVQTSGQISTGLQQVSNDSNSSKLTEYQDLSDNVYLAGLRFDVSDPARGWYARVAGANVSRRDQQFVLSFGRASGWRSDVAWSEVPHNLSNKARSPYTETRPGLFTVPQTMAIPFKKLATGAPDTAGVLASDQVTAAYGAAFALPIELRNQTNTGLFRVQGGATDRLGLDVQYRRRTQAGSRLTYGPIGDRPPRTLNIELPEPVDYRTSDLTLAAERHGERYQTRVEYLLSDFANQVDTLFWQNVYATPQAGGEFDVWDRLVGAFGVRPLPPDNRYHQALASGGVDLPRESRLNLSASYGLLTQNEPLLPYAYQAGALTTFTLPRSTADARITTASLSTDYVVTPIRRLTLRGFFRQFDLNNDTPSGRWQYVTSDTANLNGTVSYVNKRVSVPFAWNRQNLGADATWRVPVWKGSLGLSYEREAVTRDHREADTTEHILKATWRGKPSVWLTLRGRYLLGAREGGVYDNTVTREGYWYAPQEANDSNNPAVTFDNHPDMRRWDVSDRRRDLVDFSATITPGRGNISVSATACYRRDDFDSDVTPSQPLAETTFADRLATSPGDQLGLLRDSRRQVTVEVFYAPQERVTASVFVGLDRGASGQRSLEFNENNKANPSTIAAAELGPWTRAGSQWTADSTDRMTFAGAGGTFVLVPDRATLAVNYTLSLGRIDIDYRGYGVTNYDGTPFPPNHQFAFQSPPQVRHESHVADVRLEVPTVRNVTLVVGYTLDTYRFRDWQQEPDGPWVELVGSELLLRDSSRSFQWGNRLFTLGAALAPGYTAHIGFLGFTYRF